jgi:NTP pyrophosphatase (non-canonical NTP hydrolase)
VDHQDHRTQAQREGRSFLRGVDTEAEAAGTLSQPQPLAELQKFLDQWIRNRGGYWSPLSQYARLAEEVGELGRELNHQYGDKPRGSKDKAGSLAEELADVLFIIVLLANQLEVDLDEALRQALTKYESREV